MFKFKIDKRCLISAAFVTFLGYCDETQRKNIMNLWLKICNIEENFDIVSFLSSETEQVILLILKSKLF